MSAELEALRRALIAAGIDPEAALDELRSKHGKAAPVVTDAAPTNENRRTGNGDAV